MRGLRVEFRRVGAVEAPEIARDLDDHALKPEAQTQRRNAVLAGVANRAELALDAPDPEAARHEDAVHPVERAGRARGVLAVVGGHPPDFDLRVVRDAAGTQRLRD